MKNILIHVWIVACVLLSLLARDIIQKDLGIDYKSWMDYAFVGTYVASASSALYFI
jgi:hypothetical protein